MRSRGGIFLCFVRVFPLSRAYTRAMQTDTRGLTSSRTSRLLRVFLACGFFSVQYFLVLVFVTSSFLSQTSIASIVCWSLLILVFYIPTRVPFHCHFGSVLNSFSFFLVYVVDKIFPPQMMYHIVACTALTSLILMSTVETYTHTECWRHRFVCAVRITLRGSHFCWDVSVYTVTRVRYSIAAADSFVANAW